MSIAAIQPFSTVDFPGTIACVVFTRGCNLNCFYCHNRELISGAGETLETDDALDFLKKRAGLLEGVVVTGGEPALWDGLEQFLSGARALGYKTKLDTNGQLPERVKAILQKRLADYTALDVKAPAEDCENVCGDALAFDRAAETAELLAASGVDYELRTTLYPGMTLDKLKGLLARFPAAPLWRLNSYRRPEVFDPRDEAKLLPAALTAPELAAALTELKKIQPNVIIPE